MVKDYINGYIASIWVIFDSFLMYILSLNCKILLMCCILNLRVAIFLPCSYFHTPNYPRNCFGVLVRGYPGKWVLDARKRGWLGLFRRVLFKQMMKCTLDLSDIYLFLSHLESFLSVFRVLLGVICSQPNDLWKVLFMCTLMVIEVGIIGYRCDILWYWAIYTHFYNH